MDSVAYIDAAATMNTEDGKTILFVLNRDLSKAHQVEVVWEDTPKTRVAVSQVFTGNDLKAVNGFDAPERVKPQSFDKPSTTNGRTRFEVSPAFRATVSAVQAPAAITAGRYVLDFTPGTVVEDIKVVMTRRVSRFVATVVDETEKPLTSGSLILLPPRPDPGEEVGTQPGSTGMGFLANPTGDRGEYAIEDVLPGAYLAIAIDIPPYLLNLDSDLMERARAAAIPIDLAPGELRRPLRVVPLRRFVTVGLTDTGPRLRH